MSAGPQAERRTTKAEWRTARRLYAIYSGVVTHFDVGVQPSRDLESPIDRADFSVRGRVRNWLSTMDSQCPVAYLRQVLQRDPVGSEANLLALIRRHLERPCKTDLDREKLDFLLVQYFSQAVADEMSPEEITLPEVARVLQPVLGHWAGTAPFWLKDLETLIAEIAPCTSMQDLEDRHILERGRAMKAAAGARFYEPPALIAFARYNIIVRRAFFYCMRADLDAVRQNVEQLEKLGVRSLDATHAGLSERESLASIARICRQWRTIFQSDYSADHISRAVRELSKATEHALSNADGIRPVHESPAQNVSVAQDDTEKTFEAGLNEAELNIALSMLDEPPENTVERAYPELVLDSDPISGAPARFNLRRVITHIYEQVSAAAAKDRKAESIRLEHSSVSLASWERKAFELREGGMAGDLQTSVAARLILQEAFDDFQDGYPSDLAHALAIAHCDAGRMQEKIAEACDARDTARIVRLAATAQRLLELVHEAEFAWNEEKR